MLRTLHLRDRWEKKLANEQLQLKAYKNRHRFYNKNIIQMVENYRVWCKKNKIDPITDLSKVETS